VPESVGDGWAVTERLAIDAGLVVSPGEFYGPDGAGFVRIAVVQPMERLQLVAGRLAGVDVAQG
jgi:aspartate/methionine/tyrosine aminotransferase